MEDEEYDIGHLLDFIGLSGGNVFGNPDIFRKALYEKHFLSKVSGKKINRQEACFAGTLFLEEERTNDVHLRQNKTFRQCVRDFSNLEIAKVFGLSLNEYLNFSPKDIDTINKVAKERIDEIKSQVRREISHLGSFVDE